MSEIILQCGEDYPLDGNITFFEAYMFVTTDKFLTEHGDVENGVVVAGNTGCVSFGDWSDLGIRKKMLSLFNQNLKQVISNFPSPDKVSCTMIEFDGDIGDMNAVMNTVQQLQDIFVQWCIAENRVGACVPHVYQLNRVPHVHLLYQRANGKHDEFQTYLMSLSGETE